jgi:hypothetical protein
MRIEVRFALVFSLAVACSADDSATGVATTNIDNAREGEPSEDAGAEPTDLDAALADAARDSADASLPTTGSDDAEVETAEDAGDAGEGVLDASAGDASDGKHCGVRNGITCKAGEFCDFAGDPQCGATDKGGVCRPSTKLCAQLYAPVCGCDKRTYAGSCSANGAGISVLHQGLCTRDECVSAGGMVHSSLGAGLPSCDAGQDSWAVGGSLEPSVCCLTKSPPKAKL